MDSPLPSPGRSVPGYHDSSSESSDSDSVGEIDDSEAPSDQLDCAIEDLMRQDCETSGSFEQDGCKPETGQTTMNSAELTINRSDGDSNSDDGFDEGGDVEKSPEPIINSEATRQTLSLILGGLSSYTCESEENSRLSGSDDPVTAGPSLASDPGCLPSAAESLLADRPFSVVTMDTMLTKQDFRENPDQIEDVNQGNIQITGSTGPATSPDSL